MDSLRRKLGIESAETRPFLLMLLLAFLTGGGNVFIDAASNALFVAEYGADKLPLVYIVAAFGLITVGYGYGRLEKRIAVGRLMSGTMLFICAFTAAIKLGLDLTQDRNFIFAALVWYRVVFIFSDLVFWVVAGIVFSLQQGKRLFGLISTGSVLARILGYLLIPVLVTFIGSANLIYLSAALMAAAWAIVWKIMRGIEEQEQADVPSHQPKTAKKEAVYERPTYYIYLMYAVYGRWLHLLLSRWI